MMRIVVLYALLATPLLAADPPKLTASTDTLDPPTELAAAVRDLLTRHAYTATDSDGRLATVWLRKDLSLTPGKGPPTYRAIQPGTLVGSIRLHRAWSDFRSQEVPAGFYTLRYVLQPETKDHEGTAPQRDFVILVAANEDGKPDVLPLKTIVAKSGKTTGGTHPVVMLLDPHPKPAAEPAIQAKGKRQLLGVRGPGELGFAFTLIGSSTDR
jgi:hypothetical protein